MHNCENCKYCKQNKETIDLNKVVFATDTECYLSIISSMVVVCEDELFTKFLVDCYVLMEDRSFDQTRIMNKIGNCIKTIESSKTNIKLLDEIHNNSHDEYKKYINDRKFARLYILHTYIPHSCKN